MDQDTLVSFSVSCKHKDIPRVKSLLSDLGVSNILESGDHIHGMCEMHELKDLMKFLSKHEITEFTQESMNSTTHFTSKNKLN